MCYTSWCFFCNELVANLVCCFVMLQIWGFEFATHLGFFLIVLSHIWLVFDDFVEQLVV